MTLPQLPERPLLHSYNPTTKEYLGSSVPEYDVLHLNKTNELKFMDLAFTTFEPVPEFGPNEKPVLVDGKWVVLKDHRGETWFDGVNAVMITQLGDPAEAKLTRERVVPEDPYAIKNQRMAELLTKLSVVAQKIGSFRPNETLPPELLEQRRVILDEMNALEE